MFNPINKIVARVSQTLQNRRENDAMEVMLNEQRIRCETIDWLSQNGLLKAGVN